MAVFRAFYRSFGRTLFVSVLCFAFGFMSAWAEEYTIAYLNQYGDEISDLTPDRYTEKELPLARENLPNGEAVSIATGCELVDELWYWDDKMSEPVESIEPEPLEDKVLYGNLSCDENRIVTLNPAGKEEIGSKGTEQLYYYHNLGDYGEFFYNEYNGSKSAAGLASTIILPTYDTEKYTFLGYYADPDDMETQCVDERGYITKYGFQQMAEGGEGETSWDAVYEERSVSDVPQYTLTYDCGVNGTAPAGVTNGGSNVQLANGCNGALSSDYDFKGWYCVPQNFTTGSAYNGGDSYPLYDNTICTAIWTESNPCDPGTVVDQVILGMYDSDFDQWHESLVDNDNTTWSFPYGDVYLEGMCSNTPGVFGVSGNPEQSATSADNTYCWCRASSFTPTGGENPISLDNNSWVYSGIHLASGCTDSQCQNLCAGEVETINGWQDFFLPGLYTANICEYTLTYDCANGNNAQSALFGGNYQGGQSMGLWANGGNCTAPTNQTFDYWTCDNGTVNNNMVNPTPYDNMTCTAHWKQVYTLNYNCGDGTGSPWTQATYDYTGNTQNIATLTGAQASSHCTAPTGYQANVTSWNCGGNNTNVTPGNSISINNTTTCTAQWTPNTNPIIYKCGILNNDATAHDPTYVATGATQDLTNIEPVYCTDASTLGYTFSHWKCCYTNANTLQGNVDTTQNCPANTGSSLWSILPGGWIGTVCEAQWTQAPTTYTVTYHGGSCNASASTFNETVDAGASYTVENPECASSNSNDWLPTDGCSNFIGWSDSPYDSTQTASSQVVYGTCDACATQTGSCGTISNISSNIDLYAICDVMAHNVIYHNCDGDEVYTHSNAISLSDGAQSVDYTPLSPSDSQLSSLITPLSSFQGWATSETAGDDESWCGLEPGDLYQELYGGNSNNDYYKYTKTGEICTDVDLYAVCCPLNLNWDVNGGSWPTGSSGNQTTCEYGAIAGSAGSIGYGQTPLQTPLRTGYTFTGWKVTNYSTP